MEAKAEFCRLDISVDRNTLPVDIRCICLVSTYLQLRSQIRSLQKHIFECSLVVYVCNIWETGLASQIGWCKIEEETKKLK